MSYMKNAQIRLENLKMKMSEAELTDKELKEYRKLQKLVVKDE